MADQDSTRTLVSRRFFLKLAGAALASGIIVPALTPPRDPYVREGEVVSYIGLGRHPDVPTFIGATTVAEIGHWDGAGYPCLLRSYTVGERFMPTRFYDTDLACFNREIPNRFWWSEHNQRRYKNVHVYVREQRYGEIPPEIIRTSWAA